jgi:hypothetical protein
MRHVGHCPWVHNENSFYTVKESKQPNAGNGRQRFFVREHDVSVGTDRKQVHPFSQSLFQYVLQSPAWRSGDHSCINEHILEQSEVDSVVVYSQQMLFMTLSRE